MKKQIFVLLMSVCIKSLSLAQRPELSLLQEKIPLDKQMLDAPLKDSLYPSDVIMLRITRSELTTDIDSANFQIEITVLNQWDFKFINIIISGYFGFFKYQNHTVLVYGDKSPGYFFVKTTTKKSLDFIPTKAYVIDRDHPPIPIEAGRLIFTYKNGKVKFVGSGVGFSY